MRSETAMGSITRKPNATLLMKEPMKFLIMDAPRSNNLHQYIKEFRTHNVTDVVRVCEATYPEAELTRAGISLHEMPYSDGHSPPDEVLDRWLKLVDETFIHPTKVRVSGTSGGNAQQKQTTQTQAQLPASSVTPSSSFSHNNNNNSNNYRNGSSDNLSTNPNTNAAANTSTHSSSPNPNIMPTIAVHCVAGLGRAPVLVAIALIEFARMEPEDAASLIRKHRRGAINGIQLAWLQKYKRRFNRSGAGCSCIVM